MSLTQNSEPLKRTFTADVLPSEIELIKQGIINKSKDKMKVPYTILLVGGTGVGKSSVVEFITNVLLGKDTDHYDFDILDHANEQGDSDDQSQTRGIRLYEFTSINGIVVSCSALNLVSRCNLFPRFASSTHLGSPRPAMSSKTSSTRRRSPIRSENKLTL